MLPVTRTGCLASLALRLADAWRISPIIYRRDGLRCQSAIAQPDRAEQSRR